MTSVNICQQEVNYFDKIRTDSSSLKQLKKNIENVSLTFTHLSFHPLKYYVMEKKASF